MRRQGLRGVMRGKVVRTTVSDSKAPCPLDRVNQLWVSSSMRTDFVLDPLEQALYARQPERDGSLVCHSDRGSQGVSIRCTERLAEAGIEPSVELATLEWVSWFNHHRLLEPAGYVPPAEAEADYYRQLGSQAMPV